MRDHVTEATHPWAKIYDTQESNFYSKILYKFLNA